MEDNPIQTQGFAFVEYAGLDLPRTARIFEKFGFTLIGENKKENTKIYAQGNILFILNGKPDSHAKKFSSIHQSGACSIGFKVQNEYVAYKRAVERGGKTVSNEGLLPFFALQGVGNSLIYLVESIDDIFLRLNISSVSRAAKLSQSELFEIDHLTHNVKQGNLPYWREYYEKVFNFKEKRFFEISGKHTGLISKVMVSPCGKIRIPINESVDEKSQIEEFIEDFNGEGIQHIALQTSDIIATVKSMKNKGVNFLNTPDTYYELIDQRLPWHNENINLLKEHKILIDGDEVKKDLLLQIFTENLLGPVFFEVIQRKGNVGFGEGNFQALFESIELDQIKRGTLQAS